MVSKNLLRGIIEGFALMSALLVFIFVLGLAIGLWTVQVVFT